jgi:hypothetical protein
MPTDITTNPQPRIPYDFDFKLDLGHTVYDIAWIGIPQMSDVRLYVEFADQPEGDSATGSLVSFPVDILTPEQWELFQQRMIEEAIVGIPDYQKIPKTPPEA